MGTGQIFPVQRGEMGKKKAETDPTPVAPWLVGPILWDLAGGSRAPRAPTLWGQYGCCPSLLPEPHLRQPRTILPERRLQTCDVKQCWRLPLSSWERQRPLLLSPALNTGLWWKWQPRQSLNHLAGGKGGLFFRCHGEDLLASMEVADPYPAPSRMLARPHP